MARESPALLLSYFMAATFGCVLVVGVVATATGLYLSDGFGWARLQGVTRHTSEPDLGEPRCSCWRSCCSTVWAFSRASWTARGMATTRAGVGAILQVSEIAFAFMLDVVFLGERTNALAAGGTAIVFCSVSALACAKAPRRPTQTLAAADARARAGAARRRRSLRPRRACLPPLLFWRRRRPWRVPLRESIFACKFIFRQLPTRSLATCGVARRRTAHNGTGVPLQFTEGERRARQTARRPRSHRTQEGRGDHLRRHECTRRGARARLTRQIAPVVAVGAAVVRRGRSRRGRGAGSRRCRVRGTPPS